MREKNIGDDFMEITFFIIGMKFKLSENINLNGSYSYLFGPGNNYFDKSLKKPIYSYGLN